MVSWLNILLFN